MKKSLYDGEVYATSLDRLDQLKSSSPAKWGKMSAGQMLAHCKEVQLVYNGQKALKTGLLMRLFRGQIRKVVFGPKPYPKNMGTVPQFVVQEEVDFAVEKKELLEALAYFHHMSDEEIRTTTHPLFGIVPKDERGWGMYKHLNHHLVQFGV